MVRRQIKRLLEQVGFQATRDGIWRIRDSVRNGQHYTGIHPTATYAPWLGDGAFQAVYRRIRNHTLVDAYRCYELWELLHQVRHLEGGVLEVGVWRGGTGALLAARTDKPVYLCDTFTGVVKTSDQDSSYSGGEHADTSEQIVTSLLSDMDLHNARVVKGIFPDDCRERMEGERFCMVHIDVDVYQSAKDTFDFAWPRLEVGGIVVFDDYGFESCDGIPKLISQYRGQPDRVIVHNLNGHAVVVKTR